jgi:hypothetical protein
MSRGVMLPMQARTSLIMAKPPAVSEFAAFVWLQVLDFASTSACLSSGLAEGNPVIRALMRSFGDANTGMFVAKVIAVLVASRCCDRGYLATVRLANLGYVVIVAWNLLFLISTHY